MDRQRLVMRAAEIQGQLDFRLEKSEMLLNNLRDYLMLSGESRNAVFDRWCYENGLTINTPWMLGIAVATNRQAPQWRSQLPNPPETWTTNEWTAFRNLAQSNSFDCDIALTSRLYGRQFLADYGLRRSYLIPRAGQDPDWLIWAIRQSKLEMGDRSIVMLDTNSNSIIGTLYFLAVYQPTVADFLAMEGLARHNMYCARWMHLTAVIVAPVDFKVLAQTVWEGANADLGLEIFSSTNQTAETWVNITEGAPRAADPKFKAYLTRRQTWRMYGRDFSFFFYTTPLFEAQSPRRLAKVTMAAGAALTLLASALVGVALRARNRQELMLEQIREARDALAAAQQERNKISRDLHDGTIQSLYAIQLGLGHTVKKLEAEPYKAGRELSAVRAELDTVIAEIRQFITAEAGADKSVDFSAVLHALSQRARASTTAQIVLHCDPGASKRLAGDQAVQLANIAREALSNSLRHAKPQQVEIALRLDGETVVLEISDDGTGFDAKSPARPGVGLTSMLSRAREVGGTLEIRSSPGDGTCIVVRVPAVPLERAGSE